MKNALPTLLLLCATGCLSSAHAQTPHGDAQQPRTAGDAQASRTGDGDPQSSLATVDAAASQGDAPRPSDADATKAAIPKPKLQEPTRGEPPEDTEIINDLELLQMLELLEAYDLFSDE